MKKVLFSLVVVAMAIASASAQLFVGGSIGFGGKSNSTTSVGTTVDGPSSSYFGIAPMAGYYLNSKLAVGAKLDYLHTGETNYNTNGPIRTETKTSTNNFGITPFIRYHVLEIGNLSLFGQGELGLGFGGSTVTASGISTDGPSIFTFRLGVIPGVSYKLNEKIDLEAYFGGLDFNNISSKKTTNGVEVKTSDTSFDFNLYTSFGLGFIYKF